MKQRTRNFLAGAGSILEIAPKTGKLSFTGHAPIVRKSGDGQLADAKALRSDVERIGRDFRIAKDRALNG